MDPRHRLTAEVHRIIGYRSYTLPRWARDGGSGSVVSVDPMTTNEQDLALVFQVMDLLIAADHEATAHEVWMATFNVFYPRDKD